MGLSSWLAGLFGKKETSTQTTTTPTTVTNVNTPAPTPPPAPSYDTSSMPPASYTPPTISPSEASQYRNEEQTYYRNSGYGGGSSYVIPQSSSNPTASQIQEAKLQTAVTIPTTQEARQDFMINELVRLSPPDQKIMITRDITPATIGFKSTDYYTKKYGYVDRIGGTTSVYSEGLFIGMEGTKPASRLPNDSVFNVATNALLGASAYTSKFTEPLGKKYLSQRGYDFLFMPKQEFAVIGNPSTFVSESLRWATFAPVMTTSGEMAQQILPKEVKIRNAGFYQYLENERIVTRFTFSTSDRRLGVAIGSSKIKGNVGESSLSIGTTKTTGVIGSKGYNLATQESTLINPKYFKTETKSLFLPQDNIGVRIMKGGRLVVDKSVNGFVEISKGIIYPIKKTKFEVAKFSSTGYGFEVGNIGASFGKTFSGKNTFKYFGLMKKSSYTTINFGERLTPVILKGNIPKGFASSRSLILSPKALASTQASTAGAIAQLSKNSFRGFSVGKTIAVSQVAIVSKSAFYGKGMYERTESTSSLLQIPSTQFRQLSSLQPIYSQKYLYIQQTKSKSGLVNVLGSGSSQSNYFRMGSRVTPTQDFSFNTPQLKLGQRSINITPLHPANRISIRPPKPRPDVPVFPDFNLGGSSKSFSKIRIIGVRYKYSYTPSYSAVVFNIRGKRPRGIETGFNLRPITKGFTYFKKVKTVKTSSPSFKIPSIKQKVFRMKL